MPKFTIESTFMLPVYRHRTYEADTIEAACAMAMEDDDWEEQSLDYDSSGAAYLTGAWEGEDAAYAGEVIPIPTEHSRIDPGEAITFVSRMTEFTTPEEDWKQGIEDGDIAADQYDDVVEFTADISDNRLCDEYAAFMSMVRKAREIMGEST